MFVMLAVVALAGAAYGTTDMAVEGSGPQTTPTRVLTQVGYFPLAQNDYCVGLGWDGQYVWISHGDQGGTPCMFLLFDELGNLIDQGAQGGGASGWGHRDMAYNGDHMFGSYSNLVDGFTYGGTGIFVFEGYFIGAPINPNRAIGYDGTDFYSGGFSTNLYRMEWNGTWGSAAVSYDLGGPWPGTYGIAYDCGWDCLWITTASSTGEVLQVDRTGFHLNTYVDLNHPTFGGCEMADTAAYGYVLAALAQESPDAVVFYDMESGGPSPVQSASWGEIKALF
jgi:hypothetical protein